jgi:hypothetical protein
VSEDEPSKPLELEALEFDKDLFESMSSKKQKYIMLKVSTNLSRAALAKHLGVTKSKLTRWDKDPAVVEISTTIKKRITEDGVAQMRMQNKHVKDLLFAETVSRFDDPKNASFDSIVKALKEVNNISQIEEEVAGRQDADFVTLVRKRHLKMRRQRQGFQKIASEAGLGTTNYMDLVTSNGIDYTATQTRKEPEEEYETTEVIEEEISITTRRNNDE